MQNEIKSGNGNGDNQDFFFVRFNAEKEPFQIIADALGYESYALAVRNAARVGLAVYRQDINQFLSLINS